MRYHIFYADDIDTASVGIFPTDTRSFESLVERPPWELAELITISDLTSFRHLSLQSMMDNDENYRYVGRGWNEWSLAVQEGALVGQNFAKKALEVAKAGWREPPGFPTSLNLTTAASACVEEFPFSPCLPPRSFRGKVRSHYSPRSLPTHPHWWELCGVPRSFESRAMFAVPVSLSPRVRAAGASCISRDIYGRCPLWSENLETTRYHGSHSTYACHRGRGSQFRMD